MKMNQSIIDALIWRRAIRLFDTTKKVSEEDLKTILESARLAPSSYGVEPWKFIVVKDLEVRKKLRVAGYDQPKITDASHLIVVARRTDTDNVLTELVDRTAKSQNKSAEDLIGFRKMVEGAISYKEIGVARDSWIAEQTYLALGVMIETASLLGVDNGPMEGFDPVKVSEILGLPEKNLFAVTMLALGYRDDNEVLFPKVRREYDDVVEFI